MRGSYGQIRYFIQMGGLVAASLSDIQDVELGKKFVRVASEIRGLLQFKHQVHGPS